MTLTFEIAILVLGIVSLLGGFLLKRADPRLVVVAAALLFSTGFFLASFATYGLWALYLGVGVIAGTGLGIGYIVPIAVLVRWFPRSACAHERRCRLRLWRRRFAHGADRNPLDRKRLE